MVIKHNIVPPVGKFPAIEQVAIIRARAPMQYNHHGTIGVAKSFRMKHGAVDGNRRKTGVLFYCFRYKVALLIDKLFFFASPRKRL